MESFGSAITQVDIGSPSLSAGATSFDVLSVAGMPTSGNFRIQVDNEIMLVTGVAGVTLTVTRAQDGTAAASHSNLATVRTVVTPSAIAQALSELAVVLDGSALKSSRTNAGPVDNTKLGATNLGSATGATAGAAADYASVLGGNNCEASGDYSTASGNGSKATALNATAIGELCEAQASGSVAIGVQSIAEAESSIAMGYFSRAKGVGALALGQGANAEDIGSTALGSSTFAYAEGCFAAGQNCKAGTPLAERVAENDGRFAACFGTNNVARQWCSFAVGQSCKATEHHSFAQGEDCHAESQSAVALNHFNQANGRGSTLIGCNNLSTGTPSGGGGERSFVHGYGARAAFGGRRVFAVGIFDSAHDSEDTLHAPYAGDGQIGETVLRGSTEGLVDNEDAHDLNFPAYGWLYNKFESGLGLEDDRAYHIRATILIAGVIIDGETETPMFLRLEREALATCAAGASSIEAQQPTADPFGTAASFSTGSPSTKFNCEFTTYNNEIMLRVHTGSSLKARVRVVAEVKYEELVLPPPAE